MTLTLSSQLLAAAEDSPDEVFIRTMDEELTYAETWTRVRRRAGQFREAGIRRGDSVAVVMDNSADQIVTWFALNALGALHAALNTAFTDARLAHNLTVSEASWVLADEQYLADVERVIGTHELPARVISSGALASLPGAPVDEAEPVDDLATATLLFTSGTTGASKACALSNRYLVRAGQLHVKYLGLSSDDVLYCPFPLFHIDAATLTVSAALAARATAAIGLRFSASRFWDEVRAMEATVFNFMGATLTILWKRDPDPRDRDHRVRLAWGVPMPEWKAEFEHRFGFPLFQVYGLTDGGLPAYDPIDGSQRPGFAGRVIPEYEVRIDTAARRHGDPEGVGEILMRSREPGLMMNGYFRDPGATSKAIVDGWLRTGDLGMLDGDGYLAFHGRLTDSIRRRGENISAFEVEELVGAHPDVVEVAAVGVPSDMTEEDVQVWVVARQGSGLTAETLHRDLAERGPRYLVPRYYAFVPALPKTPTEKVEKFEVRSAGTSSSWDSEAVRGD